MKLKIIAAVLFSSTLSYGAEFLPVCERTEPVKLFLETFLNKTCDAITTEDLATILRVAVPNAHITEFKDGDFTGLPNLEILNIKGNPYTTLQPGLLSDLPLLKTLVIFRTGLIAIPDDLLANNSELENLYIFGNPFRSLPDSFVTRLSQLQHLRALDFDEELPEGEKNKLIPLFPETGPTVLSFY